MGRKRYTPEQIITALRQEGLKTPTKQSKRVQVKFPRDFKF